MAQFTQQLAAIRAQLTQLNVTTTANQNAINNLTDATTNLTNTVTNLTNTTTNLTNTTTNLTDAVTNLTNAVTNNHAEIVAYMQMTPMWTANMNAGFSGQLQGPLGLLPAPLNTRDSIDHATVLQIDALNTHLGGVPRYGGPLPAKRTALANFLGITLY